MSDSAFLSCPWRQYEPPLATEPHPQKQLPVGSGSGGTPSAYLKMFKTVKEFKTIKISKLLSDTRESLLNRLQHRKHSAFKVDFVIKTQVEIVPDVQGGAGGFGPMHSNTFLAGLYVWRQLPGRARLKPVV